MTKKTMYKSQAAMEQTEDRRHQVRANLQSGNMQPAEATAALVNIGYGPQRATELVQKWTRRGATLYAPTARTPEQYYQEVIEALGCDDRVAAHAYTGSQAFAVAQHGILLEGILFHEVYYNDNGDEVDPVTAADRIAEKLFGQHHPKTQVMENVDDELY